MSMSSVEEKPFLLNFLGFVEVILNSLLTLNRLGGGVWRPPSPLALALSFMTIIVKFFDF